MADESDKPCTDESCDHGDMKKWQDCVTRQLAEGHDRMNQMGTQIKTNTDAIAEIKKDTSELVDILKAVKGGLKVLGAMGTVLKWGAGVAAGIGTLIAIFQGKWPNN